MWYFTEIIKKLVVFIFFSNLLSSLACGEKYVKYIKIVTGIIIILLVIEPFQKIQMEGGLYESFINLYKENEVKEVNKSLKNINDDISNISNSEYEKECADEIKKLLESKGFSIELVEVHINVSDESVMIDSVTVELEEEYNESLQKSTDGYIADLLMNSYGLQPECVKVR